MENRRINALVHWFKWKFTGNHNGVLIDDLLPNQAQPIQSLNLGQWLEEGPYKLSTNLDSKRRRNQAVNG